MARLSRLRRSTLPLGRPLDRFTTPVRRIPTDARLDSRMRWRSSFCAHNRDRFNPLVIAMKQVLLAGSALLCAILLMSCATPYQPVNLFGGYREEQLAPDIYRVAFFGNGYTNGQTAAEYAIHRCAELTQQRGYRYFGILAVTDM